MDQMRLSERFIRPGDLSAYFLAAVDRLLSEAEFGSWRQGLGPDLRRNLQASHDIVAPHTPGAGPFGADL